MADETQVPPNREGAGATAPTAPHATPAVEKAQKRTGPARFWANRAVRVGLVLGFVVSFAIHYTIAPWTIFPQHVDEVQEYDGELSIPVDLLNGEDQQKPEDQKTTEPPEKSQDQEGPGKKSKHPLRDGGEEEVDGGEDLDAEVADASNELADAEIAMAGDAGNGENGPRDPNALLGSAGNIQASPPLVQLLVNFSVIRQSPVGAQMGPLMSAIPQWDDFIAGTGVDAVRDTDWIYIVGASLLTTDRDAIFIHYSTSDKLVDHAVDVVAHKYDRGGPFDAGVRGVKASLGHADRAQRVFLRAQPHLLLVVPPDYAHTAAVILTKGGKLSPHIPPNEAMRLTLANPSHPMPWLLTTSMSELRLWIIPRAADSGADVYAEGDCADASGAQENAAKAAKYIQDQNSLGVRMITNGLLNNVDIHVDGTTVKGHLSASHEQLQNILGLVAGQLGVALQQNGTRAN
ncbi:MAG: hypothetical protein ACRELY_20185 [Polyangiaceae bacterium]